MPRVSVDLNDLGGSVPVHANATAERTSIKKQISAGFVFVGRQPPIDQSIQVPAIGIESPVDQDYPRLHPQIVSRGSSYLLKFEFAVCGGAGIVMDCDLYLGGRCRRQGRH